MRMTCQTTRAKNQQKLGTIGKHCLAHTAHVWMHLLKRRSAEFQDQRLSQAPYSDWEDKTVVLSVKAVKCRSVAIALRAEGDAD